MHFMIHGAYGSKEFIWNSRLLRSRFWYGIFPDCFQDCADNFAQEVAQPFEDEPQVVTDGAHDGIDLVTEAAFEKVSAHVTVTFAMADDRFNGRSSAEFFLYLAMNPALLA